MSNPIDRELTVFSAARRLPAGERAAYLEQTCAGDLSLRQGVEELLRAGEEAGEFLQDPARGAQRPADALNSPDTLPDRPAPGEKIGDRIGRYKLLQQIGEGGCGVVYMAEQEEPVRRRVALKVIKLGMDTKQVIARFEAERQALALMDHPNIAKIHDAGITDASLPASGHSFPSPVGTVRRRGESDDGREQGEGSPSPATRHSPLTTHYGRPYFVMELVRGIKITQYCDENNLSTEKRLELFIKVAQAVQHAHQKGIIHRDIKPSNILVADHDGVPVPKIIDFGIAKATTDQRLTDKTLFTAFEQFIGTPAYMSPEQARMSGLDIDTRTDIYSLGVLLYELLTGKTPFDTQDLLAAGLDEMRRTISEKEPARPSTRLGTLLEGELTATAKHRRTDAPKLVHLLRGDLDWIVMKALEKDRARRYETANGLAMDIQRYLANEAVLARPPSNFYRFQKLVRRNKLAFAAAAIIATMLLLGVVVSTWQAVRTTRAKREATAVSDFLQEMLRSANPDNLKGSDYTVRQLLDDFSAAFGRQLAGQPEVEATVRAAIGNAYDRLGATDKAGPHLERALLLRRRLYGEQSEAVAQSLIDHALNLSDQTRLSEAEPEVQQALDIYRKNGAEPQRVIHALWVLQGIREAQKRFKEVENAADEALALARSSPQRDFPEIANMLHAKANVQIDQAKYVGAENLALQAVEMHRRLHGPNHPETAWSLLVLGRALSGQHKLPEAERALRDALDTFLKYYSFQDMAVQHATRELSAVLEAKGDSTGLEAVAHRELEDANRRIDSKKADAEAWVTRGLDHARHSQWKEAFQDCEEVITISRGQKALQRNAARIEYPLYLGHSEWRFAEALRAGGHGVQAEKILREAVGVFQQAAGAFPDVPSLRQEQAYSHRSLASVLNDLRRVDEAEREHRAAIALYAELKASSPSTILYSQEETDTTWMLAITLEGAGRLDAAEAEYRHAIALHEKMIADFPNQAGITNRLSTLNVRLTEFLHRRGRLPEAKARTKE